MVQQIYLTNLFKEGYYSKISKKFSQVSTNNILNNDTWQIKLKKGGIEDWNLGSSDSERGSKNLILDRKLLNSAKSSQNSSDFVNKI